MLNIIPEELICAVKEYNSFYKICTKLDICYNGRNVAFLKGEIQKLQLDTSHFVKYSNPIKCERIEKICPVCGKTFIDVQYSDKKKHKTVCSMSCSNTYFRSNENHPNWKGEERLWPLYRELFSLDELVCKRCGYKEFSCSVDIHHIDENRKNNNKENLIPLCANCHHGLHKKKWAI